MEGDERREEPLDEPRRAPERGAAPSDDQPQPPTTSPAKAKWARVRSTFLHPRNLGLGNLESLLLDITDALQTSEAKIAELEERNEAQSTQLDQIKEQAAEAATEAREAASTTSAAAAEAAVATASAVPQQKIAQEIAQEIAQQLDDTAKVVLERSEATDARTKALEERVAELEQLLKLTRAMAARPVEMLGARLGALEATSSDQQRALEQAVADHSVRAAEASATLEAASVRITVLEEELASTVRPHVELMATLQTQVGSATTKLSQLEESFSSLRSKMHIAESMAAEARDRVTVSLRESEGVRSYIDARLDDESEARRNIAETTESEYMGMRNKATAMTEEIRKVEAKVAQMGSSLDLAISRIEGVDAQVDANKKAFVGVYEKISGKASADIVGSIESRASEAVATAAEANSLAECTRREAAARIRGVSERLDRTAEELVERLTESDAISGRGEQFERLVAMISDKADREVLAEAEAAIRELEKALNAQRTRADTLGQSFRVVVGMVEAVSASVEPLQAAHKTSNDDVHAKMDEMQQAFDELAQLVHGLATVAAAAAVDDSAPESTATAPAVSMLGALAQRFKPKKAAASSKPETPRLLRAAAPQPPPPEADESQPKAASAAPPLVPLAAPAHVESAEPAPVPAMTASAVSVTAAPAVPAAAVATLRRGASPPCDPVARPRDGAPPWMTRLKDGRHPEADGDAVPPHDPRPPSVPRRAAKGPRGLAADVDRPLSALTPWEDSGPMGDLIASRPIELVGVAPESPQPDVRDDPRYAERARARPAQKRPTPRSKDARDTAARLLAAATSARSSSSRATPRPKSATDGRSELERRSARLEAMRRELARSRLAERTRPPVGTVVRDPPPVNPAPIASGLAARLVRELHG